ncbi:hypothetical protein AMJ80_09445 [bacterium SM23_31]|nr:MAG: hypothetical protein AMJ80_09445 [bacterium SM23_31]
MKKQLVAVIMMTLILSALFIVQVFAQKIDTIDGVRVVHNEKPKLDDKQALRLEFSQKIGGLDATDDAYTLYLPTDMAKDSEGNIYVFDKGNFRVQKYNAGGEYLTSFGREGYGPGEFSFRVHFAMKENEHIVIYDDITNLLHEFQPDGKLVDSKRMNIRLSDMRFLSTGDILLPVPNNESSAGFGRMQFSGRLIFPPDRFAEMASRAKNASLFTIHTLDGKEKSSFGKLRDYPADHMIFNMNKLFFTTDANGNIYATFLYQNRIDKYSPEGKLLFSCDRELNFRETKPDDLKKVKIVTENMGGGVVGRSVEEPSLILMSVSQSIAVDAQERIWVATFRRQLKTPDEIASSGQWTYKVDDFNKITVNQITYKSDTTDLYQLEVFDAEGVLLCIIPINLYVSKMYIYGDKLYIVDEKGGMQVVEYSIIEP